MKSSTNFNLGNTHTDTNDHNQKPFIWLAKWKRRYHTQRHKKKVHNNDEYIIKSLNQSEKFPSNPRRWPKLYFKKRKRITECRGKANGGNFEYRFLDRQLRPPGIQPDVAVTRTFLNLKKHPLIVRHRGILPIRWSVRAPGWRGPPCTSAFLQSQTRTSSRVWPCSACTSRPAPYDVR